MADQILDRIKRNRWVTLAIAAAAVATGILGFWDRVHSTWERYVRASVVLTAMNPTDQPMIDAKMEFCRYDGSEVRSIYPAVDRPESDGIRLTFTFTNQADRDAVFDSVDFVVTYVGSLAGGLPGAVVPNHEYEMLIEHRVGTQVLRLNPAYRIPANDTGAFTILFLPKEDGQGRCWILHGAFHTNLGTVVTEEFAFLLSKIES